MKENIEAKLMTLTRELAKSSDVTLIGYTFWINTINAHVALTTLGNLTR